MAIAGLVLPSGTTTAVTNYGPAKSCRVRTILATEASHTCVGEWWTAGHNRLRAQVCARDDRFSGGRTGGGRMAPDFHDGVREMLVLDARL
jgi:hypothetical protein